MRRVVIGIGLLVTCGVLLAAAAQVTREEFQQLRADHEHLKESHHRALLRLIALEGKVAALTPEQVAEATEQAAEAVQEARKAAAVDLTGTWLWTQGTQAAVITLHADGSWTPPRGAGSRWTRTGPKVTVYTSRGPMMLTYAADQRRMRGVWQGKPILVIKQK